MGGGGVDLALRGQEGGGRGPAPTLAIPTPADPDPCDDGPEAAGRFPIPLVWVVPAVMLSSAAMASLEACWAELTAAWALAVAWRAARRRSVARRRRERWS